MNYTEILAEWANLTNIPTTDAGFIANAPTAIAYAEERITRELDLMAANVTDATSSTTAGSRKFTLPTTYGTFLVVSEMNAITPASTAPDSGTRNPLQPVSQAFLDLAWGSSTGSTVPQYYSWVSQDTFLSPPQVQIILGPWPDTTYRIEVVGKVQPTPISASNATNWISVNLPALYIAAGMVQWSGYMRNYGSSADDPGMPGSWETQYKTLFASAATWQARARFGGASWTSKQIEPMAQNQRG